MTLMELKNSYHDMVAINSSNIKEKTYTHSMYVIHGHDNK
jgi:hypothetical protein